MIKKRILFIFVLCLFLFVSVVNAETLTGTLGGGAIVSTTSNFTTSTNPPNMNYGYVYVKSIENSGGSFSLIRWTGKLVDTFDAGAPSGATTSFNLTSGAQVVATGTMGYQRIFDNSVPPVEQLGGYTWMVFDTWNITGLSGDKYLVLNFNHSKLYNIYAHDYLNPTNYPPVGTGAMEMNSGGNFFGGTWLWNRNTYVSSDYTVTRPSGLGIVGSVNKNGYNSRAFITNSTGGVITSDTTSSTTTFNFSIIDQAPIYIKMFTPNSLWYNSSALFASIPTPTPTPTPYGTGSYNATFTVKNASSNAVIPLAFVEIEDTTTGSVFSGYTDSNGQITISYGYSGVQNELRIWKSGYQYFNWLYTPTSDFIKTVYLYPEIGGNPSIPETVNINIYVKDQNGNTPISGAYVALKDDIYGTSKQAQLTNASGTAYFPNFPSSAYIDLEISKSGYVPLTEYFGFTPSSDFGMTKYLSTTGGVTPTPTPTPVTYDTLSLTATPNTISLGQTVSLTGSSSNATRVTYAGGLRRTVFMVNKHASAYPFDFHEIGMFENVNATYWKFRSSYSSVWGAPSTASPLTMTNVPDTNGLYTYAFIGYETLAGGSGAIATAGTADVTVNGGSGAGSLTMTLSASDGSNTNHLSNYQMNITDDNSGTVTELGNISYDIQRNLPRGNSYTLRASKENYEDGTKTFIVPVSPDVINGDFGTFVDVPLFPKGTLSAGNTTVTVHVDDIETYYPLGNVQIIMSYDGTIKYTGTSGESAFWILPQNTAYTVKAIKNGYCAVSESKNTGTNAYQYVPLFMKYGSCQGTTPTPTPTVTPSVTVTPVWNTSPNTGVIVCNQLPEDATFVDVLKNSLACNGLKDAQSQSLGLACMIILICAIVLGRIAKGIGVLSGVIAGTVLSTVAGFLPFWIIIVVVIIAGLVFAAKVFWSNGG
jgi:hypothetical protein